MINPAAILSDLYHGSTFGSITIGDIPSKPGTITSASTIPETIMSGGVTHNGAEITINDLLGSFISGNAETQVVTLLHELGHAINDIFGAGSSAIQPDSNKDPGGIQASMNNTTLVDTVCVKNATPAAPVLLP